MRRWRSRWPRRAAIKQRHSVRRGPKGREYEPVTNRVREPWLLLELRGVAMHHAQ